MQKAQTVQVQGPVGDQGLTVTPSRSFAALVVLAVLALVAAPATANPVSQTLRAEGSRQLYNFDLEAARETFKKAVAADPSDSGAYRGLASVLWAQTASLRGSMTVDSYLGGISRSDVSLPPPPAALATAFKSAVDQATALARARVTSHPDDVDAQYDLGAAIGLRASYAATVEGSVMSAFRAARGAYEAHERVLQISPTRHDAALIVGTYRYVVAAMSLPLRWAAYIAGFGGGAEAGLQMVESAARYPGDSQTDAQIALVLLYNRERRYDDALQQLRSLRERYPRNRLFVLEAGSTSLRANHLEDAERTLSEGIDRLASDTRPRTSGEEALWYYKRGAARAGLGKDDEARRDLEHALKQVARPWVHARTHLELGKLAAKAGRTADARQAWRSTIALCQREQDEPTADEARRLLKTLR
jgi:tetratricopeptide (TPR) repeat protein